jgi:hypothetical protein
MDATLLPIGSVNASTVKIQPVVLLQICDAFIRRNEKQERVIGTLLGNTSADGVVEVKSCYVVPHTESDDQVSQWSPQWGAERGAESRRVRAEVREAVVVGGVGFSTARCSTPRACA